MRVLYALDWWVTVLIQRIAKAITRKTSTSVKNQALVCRLVLVTGFAIVGGTFLNETYLIGFILAYVGGVICMFFLASAYILIANLLRLTHMLLDRETAKSEELDLSHGYFAWGAVITSLIYGLSFWYLVEPWLILFFTIIASSTLLYAYVEFAQRTRHNRKRKDSKKSSAALDRLLERCRDFIPTPAKKQPGAGTA